MQIIYATGFDSWQNGSATGTHLHEPIVLANGTPFNNSSQPLYNSRPGKHYRSTGSQLSFKSSVLPPADFTGFFGVHLNHLRTSDTDTYGDDFTLFKFGGLIELRLRTTALKLYNATNLFVSPIASGLHGQPIRNAFIYIDCIIRTAGGLMVEFACQANGATIFTWSGSLAANLQNFIVHRTPSGSGGVDSSQNDWDDLILYTPDSLTDFIGPSHVWDASPVSVGDRSEAVLHGDVNAALCLDDAPSLPDGDATGVEFSQPGQAVLLNHGLAIPTDRTVKYAAYEHVSRMTAPGSNATLKAITKLGGTQYDLATANLTDQYTRYKHIFTGMTAADINSAQFGLLRPTV